MRIETERLYLREMTPDDFGALSGILRDEQTMYAYNGAFTEAETRAWLDTQIERCRACGFGLWAVARKSTDEMIGQCGLSIQMWKEKRLLEVGYLFQRAHWHKGYATEAARACRDYAFSALGAEAVYSIVRDTNEASANVARRNGMTAVDTWVKRYRGADMPHNLFCARNPNSAAIETARLTLMPLTPRALRLWLTNLPALEATLGISCRAEPLEGFFRRIVEWQANIAEKDPENYLWHSFWLLVRKADRVCVGSADFKDVPDENGQVEIGYGLGKTFERNGYMTEAVNAMCGWALTRGRASRVVAETETDNKASQNVLRKCGFRESARGETVWWEMEK